jgi:hypothetical protein
MGFEPTYVGFANRCLTTWLPHRFLVVLCACTTANVIPSPAGKILGAEEGGEHATAGALGKGTCGRRLPVPGLGS